MKKQPKKQAAQRILLTIKKIGINGEGIGFYKKKITFVKGALPDEVVFCEITDETRGYIIAKLLKVKSASPHRVAVEEAYVNSGGHQLMHVAYDQQLIYKRQILLDAFNKHWQLTPQLENLILPTLTSPKIKGYRNKNQYPISIENGKVVAGLYQEGTNELVDINEDSVLNNVNNEITKLIKQLIIKYRISISKSKKVLGIRYIATRSSFATGDVQAILIANSPKIDHLDKLVAKLSQHKRVKSIILNITEDDDHLVMGRRNITLYGEDYIIEKIGNISYQLSANSFFQLNPLQTKVLYDKVIELSQLTKEDTVLDAFCGVGTIGIYCSQYCKEVYGMDLVKEAIKDAQANIERNNITNCQYVTGDANKLVQQWVKAGKHFDVAIVDPPRIGLGGLAQQLMNTKAKKIVYVSCNPSSLAKDLKILTRKYHVRTIQPLDMFPHTPQVEAVVLLERK